tara:strand:+ start:246 stop:512 length:267 start_codon:yes stop_codon:yes gene_type:complete
MTKKTTRTKITHAVCGRVFRTKNGLKTHVHCVPLTKNTPAPAANKTAPAQVSVEAKLIEKLTEAIMLTNGGKFVNANIRAHKQVAAMN